MNTQRPPIVTVLGHVDHGKTTLLDAIRKTSIAAREAGGITQGIGASQIDTNDGKITFVDTPGHAAFAKMRSRGAKIADIAVLVVAADDGLMPQTREALSYILENKIPFIVAFTKVDLPSANIEKARGQLMEAEVFFEGMGGQTPSVEVSAPQAKGIDELLELIHLMAGVNEIVADEEGALRAIVIESNKDKRGTLVSVVVKNGTLKVGDEIEISGLICKVKGLFDEKNKPVKQALPGDPVAVLGFSQIPEVGAEVSHKGQTPLVEPKVKEAVKKVKVGKEQLGLVLKAQTSGALEAILAMLPEDAVVLNTSVGDITETDVFFAKTSGAILVAFESKVPAAVGKLAETEGVQIATFSIIYELAEFIEKKVEEVKTTILGRAEILAEFPFNKTRVAGCKVIEGRIQKNDAILLVRGEKTLSETKVVSLRRGKNDIFEAKAGEECGIIMSPLPDFEKNDILVATKPATAKTN